MASVTLVALVDIDRPALPALLAARGLAIDPRAAVMLVASGAARAGPLVMIEVTGPGEAAAALDAGAADAVLRGDPDALVAARLAALARRVDAAPIVWGDLAIDPVGRRVTRAGRNVALLPREYAVLLQLARAAGDTVDRRALRVAVWGRDLDPGTNVIEVHVSRLRAKLHGGFAAPVLLTDKGRGYRLAPVPIAA